MRSARRRPRTSCWPTSCLRCGRKWRGTSSAVARMSRAGPGRGDARTPGLAGLPPGAPSREGQTMVSVMVMDYTTGGRIGEVEIDEADRDDDAGCRNPAYQWPEGIARATDALSAQQVEAPGIDPRTTIYLSV